MTTPKSKLLIYILAQNAQDQLENVIRRIPDSIFSTYDSEILIIDDSSVDNTFMIALRHELQNKKKKIKVLYNPLKQDYGNNLKLGFEYAIKNNFEGIVILHGSGIYAPEVLLEMVSPLFENKADMVIGTRVRRKKSRTEKKIPLHKLLGNKILRFFQNKMLNTELTDFYSGFRAYRVNVLKSIPFKTNSASYLFDTQIIIQFTLAKKRIIETDVPAYSGKEMYLIKCIGYGFAGIRATLASKLHKLSIFYRREYDLSEPFEEYSLKLGYLSSHSLAIDNTKANSKVLDIGGGQGRIAAQLKKKGCFVAGIDKCTLKDNTSYDKFYQKDLDHVKIDFDITEYETVLLLDIIEHLASPEFFMDLLRREFGLSQPKIIITTPNVAFFITRLQLLLGKFNYGKEGILDMTHKRLFTIKTLKKTCQQCGYKVEKIIGIPAPYPKAIGLNGLGKSLLSLNKFIINLNKSLFSYQIYMELKPTPVVEALLENTVKESNKKKAILNNSSN